MMGALLIGTGLFIILHTFWMLNVVIYIQNRVIKKEEGRIWIGHVASHYKMSIPEFDQGWVTIKCS